MDLGQILKTGFNMTETGQRYGRYKADQEDRSEERRRQDQQFAELMTEKGAKFVHGGVVLGEDGIARTADKARTVKHKTTEGEELAFELPTPEEQLASQTKRLMEQFQAQGPQRRMVADENVDTAARTETARVNARNQAEAADTEANGIEIPDTIASVLGLSGQTPRPKPAAPMSEGGDPGKFEGKKQRKVNVDQLDNLIRTSGTLLNYKSLAEQRDSKPARAIKSTEKIEDKSTGKVVQVITYDDGSIEEKPLSATVAKEKPGGAGGLTAGQQLTQQNRADDKKAANIKTWQDKLDTIQKEQTALVQETETASAEYGEIQAQLAEDAFETASQKSSAIRKSAELKAKIIGTKAKHKTLEKQKAQVESVRSGLLGQSPQGGAGKSLSEAAASDAVSKAVTVAGYDFPDQAAADKFIAAAKAKGMAVQ